MGNLDLHKKISQSRIKLQSKEDIDKVNQMVKESQNSKKK